MHACMHVRAAGLRHQAQPAGVASRLTKGLISPAEQQVDVPQQLRHLCRQTAVLVLQVRHYTRGRSRCLLQCCWSRRRRSPTLPLPLLLLPHRVLPAGVQQRQEFSQRHLDLVGQRKALCR